MITSLRRLFWLALLGGAGYAVWTAWQRHNGSDASAPPEWPPIDTSVGSAPAASRHVAEMTVSGPSGEADAGSGPSGEADAATSDTREVRWVEPVDGDCPEGYPVKANDNSMIFHMPGGRFYDRTVPERCYADAADAEADGYRRAKA